MQTSFTLAQLADPDVAEANAILRTCVHCGFCTATCPTYVLLGDELDGPRGRIYLVKDMLENGRPASATVATHIDRCLSCLACMTTCPSGVNYMHLVDHARRHIEETYRRPLAGRLVRGFLAAVMPNPGRFRFALAAARLARLVPFLVPPRLKPAIALAPKRVPRAPAGDGPGAFPAQGPQRKRVALLAGCVQSVLAPEINAAAVRLLTRLGCEVVVAPVECCGSLTHHLGKENPARASAKAAIAAWSREIEGQGLDAIVVTASGCGVTLKDYGFMFRNDPAWAHKAAQVSALARDVSELVDELGLPDAKVDEPLMIAYHPPCSLQHGLRITRMPRGLLEAAGFSVELPAESHLCCGSAGTYNMLQPELAGRLARRKAEAIARLEPDAIATGNIGCMVQLAEATGLPVVHTVELLDWATGGPRPANLARPR